MTSKPRRFLPSALCPGVAVLLALAAPDGGTAATFTVTNLADSGSGSLRQAVLDANASLGADQVIFTPGLNGTIAVTSGEIVIADSLIVTGPGAGVLTLDADFDSRIFRVESPAAPPIDVTLSGLTLTRGFSPGEGGAIFADDENLTILDSVISESLSGINQTPPGDGCGGNVGSFGGTLRIANSTLTGGTTQGLGLHSGGNICVTFGTFILERSTVSGGSAQDGGGIYLVALTGNSQILSSTISGNQAEAVGGGISVIALRANLTIESSTLSGNTAESGGGVFIVVSDVRIVNGTISGNFASGKGGGIHFLGNDADPSTDFSDGPLLLRLTTVSNNSAGGEGGSILVYDPSSEVQLDHSIVANGAPQDLAGEQPAAAVTANYSLIETPGEVLVSGANNLIGADPLLGLLTNNGGLTLTHHPLPGSPVIDSGNPAIPSPPATDQRGFARINGSAIDRGSVEVQAAAAIAAIPTLSEWAILALSALLLAAGVWKLRAF